MPTTLPRKISSATATKRLPTAAELPYDDGEPMETVWQRDEMMLLIESIESHWTGRKDFFASGDMFVYFSEEHVFNKDFRGPDFFLVKGVDHDKERLSWVSWEEGDRLPDVIVELLSPSTKTIDRVVKKKLYDEVFQTAEYFCFDPADGKLEGWRRNGGGYVAIEPEENGRLWSKEMEVSFDWWTGLYLNHRGRWVRMFDVHGNTVPTFAEAEAARANLEAARANASGAENERLRKELDALRQQLSKNNP